MEARKLNPTQEIIEGSVIKLGLEVDRAIQLIEEEIIKLEKELAAKKENLLFLRGQSAAFDKALKEIREEIPEGDQ